MELFFLYNLHEQTGLWQCAVCQVAGLKQPSSHKVSEEHCLERLQETVPGCKLLYLVSEGRDSAAVCHHTKPDGTWRYYYHLVINGELDHRRTIGSNGGLYSIDEKGNTFSFGFSYA